MNTTKEKARFDAKITIEQKALFETASELGGFRSLTDFVISSAQEKAKLIIKEKERIISSEKDAKIFFEAIMNPAPPNENLKKAFRDFAEWESKVIE